MSALYAIQVLNFEPTKIKLAIQVIHPDAGDIYETPGFALMLLFDNAKNNSALGQELDFENLLNEDWMRKYARGFIKSVGVELSNKSTAKSSKKSDWLSGTIEIEVVHKKWLEHLKNIQHWESAAFNPALSYHDCIAILPPNTQKSKKDISANPKEGLIPIWKYMIPAYLLSSNQEVLWVQKHGKSAYKPDKPKTIKPVTEDAQKALEGLLVMAGDEFGVVYKRANDWSLFEVGDGSCGSSYIPKESITPMVFNSNKKRLSSPLSVSRLLQWSQPVIFDADINGETIHLKVLVMASDSRILLPSNLHTLELLTKPFIEFSSSDNRFKIGSNLSHFLNQEMDKKQIQPIGNLYKKDQEDLANQIIVETVIEKSFDIPSPNLDDLTEEALIALYRFDKWPQYRISIRVSDAAFLEGYEAYLPFAFVFGSG